MELEKGDLFCVTRGFQFNTSSFAMFGGTSTDSRPRYDRSHEGRVYCVLSVAGPHVAAEIVAATGMEIKDVVGERCALNLDELEVMTVTEDFLSALIGGAA